MRAQTHHDMITATGHGVVGLAVPAQLRDLPIAQLRFDGTDIIDATTRTRFAIDEGGVKHLPELADSSWQRLDCAFGDLVYRDTAGVWVATATGATPQDARRERDRRLAKGTAITVDGIDAPIPVEGGVDDRTNLAGLAIRAGRRLAAGDATPIRYRDAANVIHHLTPDQMQALVEAGTEWVEAVHAVVWAWTDAGTVPADYTDDAHWPQRS